MSWFMSMNFKQDFSFSSKSWSINSEVQIIPEQLVSTPVSIDHLANSLGNLKAVWRFVVLDGSFFFSLKCAHINPGPRIGHWWGSRFSVRAGSSQAAGGQEPNSFARQVRGAKYSFCPPDTLTAAAGPSSDVIAHLNTRLRFGSVS